MLLSRKMLEVGLDQYWAGRPVSTKDESNFGHIIGFSVNSTDELILQVRWAFSPLKDSSLEWPIHPNNVELL